MVTRHQYIDKYEISSDSRKLIIGTIHPHDHENFKIPFFYGSKMSIWNLLNKGFNNEMGDVFSLESIKTFLSNHKIAISDTIRVCERINPTALDQDLRPIELNMQLVEQIKNSNIEEILFTRGFGKNNAFRLFYVDILGLRITPEIRRNRELVLNGNVFGRPVKLTILYSPSGASNVGISKSKMYMENQQNYSSSPTPVYDFKIDYYRNKFK